MNRIVVSNTPYLSHHPDKITYLVAFIFRYFTACYVARMTNNMGNTTPVAWRHGSRDTNIETRRAIRSLCYPCEGVCFVTWYTVAFRWKWCFFFSLCVYFSSIVKKLLRLHCCVWSGRKRFVASLRVFVLVSRSLSRGLKWHACHMWVSLDGLRVVQYGFYSCINSIESSCFGGIFFRWHFGQGV